MKVRYELDKDKFVKVYNELKVDTDNVSDLYGLASKHDKTNDKDLKDVMYAIEHNVDFEITDINTVKKIKDMYDYYEKPNRLTQQEIIDCIKEVNELQNNLRTQTMATLIDATIAGKGYNNKVEMVLTIFTTIAPEVQSLTAQLNFTDSPQQIMYVRQGSTSKILDKIKNSEAQYREQKNNSVAEQQHKDSSGSIFGDIFKSIFNWK